MACRLDNKVHWQLPAHHHHPSLTAPGTLVWRPLANPVINKIEVGILVPSHRALSHVTLQFVERVNKRFKQLELAALLV